MIKNKIEQQYQGKKWVLKPYQFLLHQTSCIPLFHTHKMYPPTLPHPKTMKIHKKITLSDILFIVKSVHTAI